jgi:hypothetical protein
MNFRRCLLGAPLLAGITVFGVQARAFELNGVWASNATLCDKMFSKTGKKVSFVPMSDLYGSGFIIEGNRIRGKAASCTIKSRKEDGSTVRLSASCSTNVAVEVMEFNLKIIDDDTVSRAYPGIELQVDFYRCPL